MNRKHLWRTSQPVLMIAMLALTGCCALWASPAPAAVPVAKEATGESIDQKAYKYTLYVDTRGDDARDGLTARTALKSLGAALAKARDLLNKGDGVRILLARGIYREGYLLLNGNELTEAGRNALLIIEGVARDQVTISGAVVDGWGPDTWQEQPGATPGMRIYRHKWPFDFEIRTEEDPADVLISFREMVILNGAMLKQEASADNLAPGRFYIDRANKTIDLALDREILPSDVIEIPEKEGLLTIRHKHNLVLRNCNFANCNPHIMGGKGRCAEGDWSRAVEICNHGSPAGTRNKNLLIEDCSFSQNNSTGLGLLEVQDVTLRRCSANTNGWKGIGLTRGRNVLLEDCETSYNAWRQLWSTSRFHDSGGIKIIPGNDIVTLRRYRAFDNTVTHGIWTDWGNTNIILDECRVEGHSATPIYLEMGRGPHLIRNCVIRNRAGIVVRASSNLIFEGNRIEAERGALISLMDDRRNLGGRRVQNENCELRRNQFVVGQGRIFNANADWKRFYDSLKAEANTYVFRQAGSGGLGFLDAAGESVSFEDWQKLGFDSDSTVFIGLPPEKRVQVE